MDDTMAHLNGLQIPRLFKTRGTATIAQARLTEPAQGTRYYVLEFDGDDECFGLIRRSYFEFGFFRLSDLHARGVLHRDTDYVPATVHDLILEKSC